MACHCPDFPIQVPFGHALVLFCECLSPANKARDSGAGLSSQLPGGGECVEFYISAFLRHHEWRVSRGLRVVRRCLRAWSGRHEVTRTAIWEIQYSVLTGSVLFSHSGDSVTNWQDPESVQLGGSELFNTRAKLLSTLCHSTVRSSVALTSRWPADSYSDIQHILFYGIRTVITATALVVIEPRRSARLPSSVPQILFIKDVH
jgi:hypothetical protein